MPYNSNIPQATDKLSVSQGNLLNNFTSLGTVLNGVDTLACLFPLLGASPATGGNIIGLYNRNNQLVWRQPGSGTEVSFTQVNNGSATQGWTIFPSGIIVAWNQLNPVYVAGTQADALPWVGTPPPWTTAVYYGAVQLVTANPGGTDVPVTVQYQSYTTGSQTLRWFASQRYPGAATGNYSMNILLIGI